jgi:uncharacterized protein (UPF0212 family)
VLNYISLETTLPLLAGHCNEHGDVPWTVMKGLRIPSKSVKIFEKEIQEHIQRTAKQELNDEKRSYQFSHMM